MTEDLLTILTVGKTKIKKIELQYDLDGQINWLCLESFLILKLFLFWFLFYSQQ